MKFTDASGAAYDVHDPTACAGQSCCVHAPSVHRMVAWPMLLRETYLMERLCEHGVGHPDPDSVAWLERNGPPGSRGSWGTHGCDGCCAVAPVVRPWLIGENNPYGDDPRYALYPEPKGCAGWRLCHVVLGVSEHEYMRGFVRRNLLQAPKWSRPKARVAAAAMDVERGGAPLVLLGARVAEAFGLKFLPFTVWCGDRAPIAVLPHPSGLSRAWNDPLSVTRARTTMRELAAVSR